MCIRDSIPSREVSRLVRSGTEAVMSAIRAARGFTGRDKIIKFRGCYHGHSDSLLVKAGSGALTTSVPDSAGVPKDDTKNTLVAEYNDKDSVEKLFKENKNCLLYTSYNISLFYILNRSFTHMKMNPYSYMSPDSNNNICHLSSVSLRLFSYVFAPF